MTAAGVAGWAGTAPAKINLFLHVTGRRGDGYHELDSLVAFADIGDRVTLRPAAAPSLTVTGPFAGDVPADGGNLALRALLTAAATFGRPPHLAITLDKRLPVASGIGGGSADAAAVLRGAAALWGVGDADPRLAAAAMSLGADVPVCLGCRSTTMRGIGEILRSGPHLAGVPVVLANPRAALPTPLVFARFRASGRAFSPPVEPFRGDLSVPARLAARLSGPGNDLEDAATAALPVIAAVRSALATAPGCLLARMSGSGATCFGLFDRPESAAAAAAALAGRGWWAEAGRLL